RRPLRLRVRRRRKAAERGFARSWVRAGRRALGSAAQDGSIGGVCHNVPRRKDLRRVMVIGSGPIVIGQAAEFDYAGTQACKSLREEGIEVILVNSNPATIMTDPEIADRVYLEPLTEEFCARIVERERPDGLLPTLGGQTGLNLDLALASSGVLEEHGDQPFGAQLEAIEQAEDRVLFNKTLQVSGEPVAEGTIASRLEEAVAVAEPVGYPVIVRP